jgi:Tol biopolymer transport system component
MRRTAGGALAVVALVTLTACDPFQPWRNVLVSSTPEGVGGDGDSSAAGGAAGAPSVAVFASDADDLVPNDENGATDVFVRDIDAGTTQLVSVATGGGAPGNGASSQPVLSRDGTKVAFVSMANDLVDETVSGVGDLYVRDLAAGTTSLATVDDTGSTGGDAPSDSPTFSADGRRLAFSSEASNLVPNDTNGVSDVYARDLVAGATSLASVNAAGTGAGNGPSRHPSWDPAGNLGPLAYSLAFESRASDLASPSDGGTTSNIFVRRMAAGTTVLASVNTSGTGGGNADSRNPVYGEDDVVVFESDGSDLGAIDANGTTDIYQRELTETATSLISANPSGEAGNGPSTWPVVGGVNSVYFQSDASDLVATDTNGTTDIFRRIGPSLTLESVNADGNDSGNGASTMPGQDLGFGLAFNSEASDLGPTDANGAPDVYMRGGGVTHVVSTNGSQRKSGNGPSRLTTPRGQDPFGPLLIESEATDLGPSVGGASQIYLSQLTGADLSLFGLAVIQVAGSAELFYNVFNQGPETAVGSVAVIQLPPGLTLEPTQGCESVPEAPALVVCSVGDLLPLTRTSPSVLFNVDAPPGTILEMRMVVGARTHDPFPSNNQASVAFEFSPP